jgi:hypothetical protein
MSLGVGLGATVSTRLERIKYLKEKCFRERFSSTSEWVRHCYPLSPNEPNFERGTRLRFVTVGRTYRK